jgi:hypothetical protein
MQPDLLQLEVHACIAVRAPGVLAEWALATARAKNAMQHHSTFLPTLLFEAQLMPSPS